MKRILVVDDNNSNLKLLKVILSSMGYEAVTANCGKEGIRIAREEIPSLILLDIKMPEMDGIEVIKILRSDEKTKNIPVIAVTAYAMKGDRQRFLAEGFDECISKPIERDEFVRILNKMLEEKYG